MLERLVVKDFALIESVEFELPRGLVLFSGETGAGKSLIVEAIGFLFGSRADSSVIREGAEECSVSGTLSMDDCQAARDWLESHDISIDDDGLVILRRGFRTNGRSFCYIQNQAVSRADLSEFTSLFADIHGQHEHQQLMNPELHGTLLDSFAGLEPERAAYEAVYRSWLASIQRYRLAMHDADTRAKERDFLKFVVNEIDSAKIAPEEEDVLLREERILSEHEKLFAAINGAVATLSGGEGDGAVSALRKACSELETARNIDPAIEDFSKRLSSAFFEVDDIAESIGVYKENMRFDPDRLSAVESRLSELRKLKKKYGPSLSDVLTRAEKDKQSLAALSDWEDNRESMEKAIRELQVDALAKAEALSTRRKAAAQDFSKQVNAILANLGMEAAELRVSIVRSQSAEGKLILKASGMDDVEFMIAPNLGESPRPLVKIASGGELSRVALAIKTILSSKDEIPLLIFDEIDTGIGGEVAVAVGSYLKNISKGRQVLCVTHLASIAAYAYSQFKVEKSVENNRTVTSIKKLEGKQREEEIARMLAGDKYDRTSLAHAAELLRRFSPSSGQFM
ncbi:MAG: DNA repair protein RecN [Spirochaetaceae bacterium]|nr:DNA repair protein RecN [Spirochaetaceae bacterium]